MHDRTNHAWINIWKGGGGQLLIGRVTILCSLEYTGKLHRFSQFQSFDIFETLDETEPF